MTNLPQDTNATPAALPVAELPLRSDPAFQAPFVLVIGIACALLFGLLSALFGGGASPTERVGSDLNFLAVALKTYEALSGHYPTTAQGLRALVEDPITEPRAKQWLQLVSQLPKDPWGNEYVYLCPGVRNPKSYDLVSKGKDGTAWTSDDIVYEGTAAPPPR